MLRYLTILSTSHFDICPHYRPSMGRWVYRLPSLRKNSLIWSSALKITKEGVESPMCFINYINCLALKIKYLIPPCLSFPFFEIGVCTFSISNHLTSNQRSMPPNATFRDILIASSNFSKRSKFVWHVEDIQIKRKEEVNKR